MKIRNFCTPKDNIKKVKRQFTEWEKVFAKDELASTIYKDLLQFKRKITQF